MELSTEQCKQIIRDAYDIHLTARPTIARLDRADAAALLNTLAVSWPDHKPDPGHFLDRLDHPYWPSAEVAIDARRLGVGVLLGDYELRRAQGELDLICQPLDTTFKRVAARAMNAMLKHWNDHTKARSVPELRTAYKKLDAMLGVLGDMMRDDQREAMRLETNQQATNLKVARVIKIEHLHAA